MPIFTYNQWWLVLLYACFMLYVGCLEASQRPAYSYAVSLLPASFADVAVESLNPRYLEDADRLAVYCLPCSVYH